MIRRIVLAAAAIIVTATSCDKTGDIPTPHTPDNTGPFSYRINGLRDTSLERIGDVRYVLLVEKLGGKAENVVLSTENLPKGMEVVFEPTGADTASYNTTMVIKTTRTPEGTYEINIRGASASTGIQNNFITVKVTPYSNHAIGLVGTFIEDGLCSPKGNINDNVTITADASVKNRIQIKGLFSGVMTNSIYADVNPDTKKLTIPPQIQNSVTFEGDGSYDDDKLVINYTVKGITINESCSSTLTRQ